ncbi:hypothetical protein KCV07_g2748, partial [Aureobasidium melanogenum]
MIEASSNLNSNIKIFVSSRKELNISTQLRLLNTPAIELETGTITPDIQSFVQHEASRLRAEKKLRVKDDDLFEAIVQELVEGSNGMFLWVSLQLQQLCSISRAGNDQYVKRALDHLPQGLIAMYTRQLGQTPLMMAMSLEMVKFLCETYDSDIDATDYTGIPVLGYFVGARSHIRWVNPADSTRILDYLHNRGADMTAKSKAGMSLVDYAVCRKDNFKLLDFLLQHNPRLDHDEHEWTSLHWACRKGNLPLVEILLEHGVKVKKLTTVYPPQSWTPYDILMHYNEAGLQKSDESILYTLGRPKEVEMDTELLENPVDYSQLVIEKHHDLIMCQLCAMEVLNSFVFHCAICSGRVCLMCNHILHNKQPDHVLEIFYFGRSAPWDVPYGKRFMVKLPYAINLKSSGWHKWLKQLGKQHRDEYYETIVATGAKSPFTRMRAKLLTAIMIRQMSKHGR